MFSPMKVKIFALDESSTASTFLFSMLSNGCSLTQHRRELTDIIYIIEMKTMQQKVATLELESRSVLYQALCDFCNFLTILYNILLMRKT
jgi:hypothetical protein